MVSIPSDVNVPGADKAVINIAAKLSAMPDVNCGYFVMPIYIVAIAKPKNTQLPLYVPVSGATIEGRVLSVGLIEVKKVSAFADLNGITYACVPILPAPILPTVWYEFRAKQYNIDFGNGLSQFSNWKSVTNIVVFEGVIDIPCPVFTPPMAVFNFDKLTSKPSVSTLPTNILFSGYGYIPMSGDFEIKINGTSIGSGSVVNGKVDFSYPGIVSDLLSKLPTPPPKSATIELIVKMGTCTFKNSTVVSLPSIPTAPLLCTGKFVADKPDIQSLLSGRTTPLTTLPVPVRLTESTKNITSIPVRILVDGREVDRRTTGFSGFDIVRTLQSAGANIDTSHEITIESLATDCTIPPLYIDIQSLKPTGIVTPLCSKLVTTVDSVNHPFEITNFLAPFYVYLRGIKEICESDPTNPAFISKLPKGTMGTITLGNLSSNFYLTDDGIVDIDLSKLIDLSSLAGAAAVITPTPTAVVQPSLQAVPGERVGSYCTLSPWQAFGQTWYDVIHDTAGKIYSGNTYDQAKYKAQQDSRCFPKVALPKVTITITHRNWSDPRNAVIGFKSSVRDGRYAEGDQAWGWGGYPKISDADYLKTVAIPKTMSYLNITRDEIAA